MDPGHNLSAGIFTSFFATNVLKLKPYYVIWRREQLSHIANRKACSSARLPRGLNESRHFSAAHFILLPLSFLLANRRDSVPQFCKKLSQ